MAEQCPMPPLFPTRHLIATSNRDNQRNRRTQALARICCLPSALSEGGREGGWGSRGDLTSDKEVGGQEEGEHAAHEALSRLGRR